MTERSILGHTQALTTYALVVFVKIYVYIENKVKYIYYYFFPKKYNSKKNIIVNIFYLFPVKT